jgi:hypothetical protein
MPGQSDGICIRNSRIASVPPVEAPMMISFSDEVSGLRRAGSAPAAAGALRQGARLDAGLGGGADLVGDQLGVLAHPALDRDLRLGHEVDRAQFQRAHGDFGAALGQRGHHQHRHRAQPHQLFEEVEAVHLGHLDVEREHVRVGLLDQLARDQRVGRHADHFHVRLARNDLAHHAADQRRVVDDQYLDLHSSLSSFPVQNRSISPPTGATLRRLA